MISNNYKQKEKQIKMKTKTAQIGKNTEISRYTSITYFNITSFTPLIPHILSLSPLAPVQVTLHLSPQLYDINQTAFK